MQQIVSTVFARATEQPDTPALSFRGTTTTCAQLADRARRMAAGLIALGVTEGDRVALVSRNHPAWFDCLLGTALVGATFVPVNWRLGVGELRKIANDSGPALLIVEDSIWEVHGPGLGGVAPNVRLTGPDAGRLGPAYEDWLLSQGPADLDARRDSDHPVMLLYTSGTTGDPKGVMVSAAAVEHQCGMLQPALRFHDHVTSLVAMPLFHLGGSGYALLGLSVGAFTVLHPEVVPDEMLRDVERFQVTHMLGVPAVLGLLVDSPVAAEVDLSSLEITTYGASPIPERLLRRALDTFPGGLAQVYGSTETCSALTVLSPEDHLRPDLTASAGLPFDPVRLKIVEPTTDETVGTGESGEIFASTPALMNGYWNRDRETAAVLTPDGWYRTGDVGHLDAEGYLYVTDRIDDMIISGGENVFPGEVERVLLDHPDVKEAAVVGCPDKRWGQAVTAAITTVAGREIDHEELIQFVRDRLAHYKCPTSIHLVAELPRNATGKILRRELRSRLTGG